MTPHGATCKTAASSESDIDFSTPRPAFSDRKGLERLYRAKAFHPGQEENGGLTLGVKVRD